MGAISLQMIDHSVSSVWWKTLVKHFIQVGDNLEIRCWREETAELEQASRYRKINLKLAEENQE